MAVQGIIGGNTNLTILLVIQPEFIVVIPDYLIYNYFIEPMIPAIKLPHTDTALEGLVVQDDLRIGEMEVRGQSFGEIVLEAGSILKDANYD